LRTGAATPRFCNELAWHGGCFIDDLMIEIVEQLAGDLAAAVLQELDIGILVCTPAIDRILLSNPAAERMLSHLDDGEVLPGVLRQSVTEALSRRAAPAGFSAAVPLRRRSGSCMYVRAKLLEGRHAALVIISGDALRERELHDSLAMRFQLSRRESQIVELVRAGMSNDEIGEQLNLSVATVKHYLYGIFTALDVHSRAKLIAVVEQISRGDG
jgi:DNA-binding NarL/FixJ family response regulator